MSAFLYRLGLTLRETGQALDRLGCQLQGNPAYREEFFRHRSVLNLPSAVSDIAPNAFVAPSAAVSGKVSVGSNSSIWYGTVVRGDGAEVTIGDNTNLQDGVIVNTGPINLVSARAETRIGNSVTVGHSANLYGVTLEDRCLVGMGATLHKGVKVETGAMVAAGSVVEEDTVIPANQLWAGNPAKFLRELKPEEKSFLPNSADIYSKLAAEHKSEASKLPPY
ncbi:hypothetical protein WJX73_001122 [Symbiochloris irregularis]|uniref:Gamma carbonic anhydrase n=1 Tax=Symbiochloris irregularis TaxID=706552 RepID=A0AAW1PUQ1_9CHLO